MLKKAVRMALAALALLAALAGPFVTTARADCSPSQGTVCPK
jgi:hypothetical protein